VKPVFWLARLYLLGSLRRQVHLATMFLAVVVFALPHYVSAFSLGLNAFERVSKDFGLSLIGVFGVAMAVLLGSTSLPREVGTRALYPLLARPVSRSQFLAAHMLALVVLLGASLLTLGSSLCLSLSLMTRAFDPGLFLAVFGSFLESMVVAAVCLAFSVKCSPALAGTIGGAVVLIGNLSGAFIRFFLVEDRDSVVSATLAKLIKGVVPNLSLFSFKEPAVHDIAIAGSYVLAVTYYALIWVVLLLSLAQIGWRRVDL
jgi:ABC-type transport system involved in multi-copper enzyme maturation permease subunit